MSIEKISSKIHLNHALKSSLLKELRKDIPKDVLDIIECSIIDASKIQLIPINPIYILSLHCGIKFESEHIEGVSDVSPSESLLLHLFEEVEKEYKHQKCRIDDNTKPNYISESYDLKDPLCFNNWLVAYSKDMRWIEVGDYLLNLHYDRNNSPFHLDYQDLRFMKNGRMVKLFSYSQENLDMYLSDLCVYLSSYSNKVRWSYR